MTTLDDLLSKYKADIQPEEIAFREYYERVLEKPELAQLAHARLYGMLTEDKPFEGVIFGADEALAAFTSIIKSGAKRMEIRKRLILLMGPPGAGKSTLAAELKKALAAYTRRHPLYAIKDCPMQEEPLHLLPESARGELAENGVHVEGGLCPYCTVVIPEKYGNDLASVPVVRISLSENKRLGIGTFEASDSKNQSNEDLVGAPNIALMTKYAEDDPRAYSYNGEITKANRGLLELIEIFKANQELLWTFLSVTQEQQVKMPRLPMAPVDVVLLAHTNQAEFDKFMAEPKNEALRDRIVPIRVPYTLSVDDEMKIYRRLLAQRALDEVHVPQMSLKVAAQFAVLTRLTESDQLKTSENKSGLVKKMRLYNGEKQVGFTASDIRQLHEESPDEGMSGEGPRQVINALSLGLIAKDGSCLTPIGTLRALDEMLEHNIQLTATQRKLYEERLGMVVELFTEDSKIEVQKGFTHGFDDAAADTFRRYIDNVGAYLQDEKIKNPITGNDEPANERFMREIEEMIGVGENQAKVFRQEIYTKMGAALAAGRDFDYASHPRLKEGIEKSLFAKLKDAIAVTTGQSNDPKNRKRFSEVVESMKELGWCEVCATELIRFVAERLT